MTAYQTVMPDDAPTRAKEVFTRKLDWVLFTSSLTVKNFIAAAGPEALEGAGVASIGPVTSDTARKLGLDVTLEAETHTVDGLIQAIMAQGNFWP